ncbi:MAG: cyclic nucleotide-binding domain-containing protein [Chloroflexota bacterium]
MTQELELRELAYRLWQEEGMPDGRDLDHWFRALALQRGEEEPLEGTQPGEAQTSRDPTSRRRGPGEKNMLAIASFLGQSRFFGVLSFEDLRALAASTEEFRFSAGAVIFQQADPGDRVYLIRAGRAKVVRHSSGGAELVLATLNPGDVFGELSVLDGKPRSATAVALEQVEGVALATDRFVDFLKARPEAALCIMRLLTTRLRQTDDALQDATFAESRA